LNKKDCPKVGVFLCHCGKNISYSVNISQLKKELIKLDSELVVKDDLFLCSESGQKIIQDTIKNEELDRVVIASCSPAHHGSIFSMCIGEIINPFMWEMTNIREQCSWVHSNVDTATSKAKALILGAINRVKYHDEIGTKEVPMNQDMMVIGGGIAGMHAAKELSAKGHKVHLIEQFSSLGGNMAKLDRTFPTNDCAMCTISPILNDVAMDPNINVHTLTTVEEFKGRPGMYKIRIKKKARKVKEDLCTGCGECTITCPVHFQIHTHVKSSKPPKIRDKKAIDAIILEKQKLYKNPIIPILLSVNEKYRYLPKDVLNYLSFTLNISISDILRIASFYKAFNLKERGKYHIKLCMGTACYVRGTGIILERLEQVIDESAKGLFSLEVVNCLGACALGPVMMVNEEIHGNVTLDKVDKILTIYGGK
jgi:NADH:ubiquinone oxidoreductase subunit E